MELTDNWYVYRHIRLDKNEPFYIGIGCKKNFSRAYDKGKRRSVFWNNIVKKTEYEIEILFEGVSKELACKKEKELISIYGRIELKNGTLCNMTVGGEAPPIMNGDKNIMKQQKYKDIISKIMSNRVVSEETKLKQSISKKNSKIIPPSQKGIKKTQESIDKQRLKVIGEKHRLAKKVKDITNGNVWNCVKYCAKENNINYSTLVNMLNGFRTNKTNFIYI